MLGMIRAAALSLGLVLLAAPAWSAEPGAATMVFITHEATAAEIAAARPDPGRSDLNARRVTLARVATAAEIAAAYPEHGRGAGTVSVRCNVAADGALAGCHAVQENPTGLDFGDAAAALAQSAYRAPSPPTEARAAFISFSLTITRPNAPPANCEPPACGAISRPAPLP
jgi:hypothetical protein